MHNAAFRALGLDYCYVPLPVSPEPEGKLGLAVRGMRALGMVGGNVTVPHKRSILPWVDDLTSFARACGAVNTLSIGPEGRLRGDNTDGPGLAAYLGHEGVEVAGSRVLVLGAGGVARGSVAGLLLSGCDQITVLNRHPERAESLLSDLTSVDDLRDNEAELGAGRFPDGIAEHGPDADIIVQCTSVGLGSDALAWDGNVPLRPGQAVCDMVYEPVETSLLAMAARCGALPLGGLGMLVFQGALSFEAWTGRKAPVDIMLRAVGHERRWT